RKVKRFSLLKYYLVMKVLQLDLFKPRMMCINTYLEYVLTPYLSYLLCNDGENIIQRLKRKRV
ncbi:hypothetical protein HMPREF9095_1104, partial [Haemophilus aegyptius ATCC 11116]